MCCASLRETVMGRPKLAPLWVNNLVSVTQLSRLVEYVFVLGIADG
jgi:hypothetical protein